MTRQTHYHKEKTSILFLGSTVLLVLLGLALMANSSIPISQSNFGESYYYLRHQLIFGIGLGIIALIIGSRIKFSWLKKIALPAIIAAAVLLALVFAPSVGYSAGGAKRWLNILGASFQPSELAKLALIIYLAYWLESKKEKIKNPMLILPILFWAGLIGGLILLEPDYGTFLIIGLIAWGMYFASGAKYKIILTVALIGLVALTALIIIEPYRRDRVISFLNPQKDIIGKSYQHNQALIAIGSGGILGRGLGKGIQKYSYLPETIGDSVFAITAEELGLAGAAGVLLLYLIWILSGLKIASKSNSLFAQYLAMGIVIWIGGQTFINVLGILGLMPFTGIPVPFLSYGGTAMVVELAAVGLVLNVAKRQEKHARL